MAIPLAGALAKASDWSTVFPTNTDAWTTYVPTWTQGGTTITKTTNFAKYMKVGRKVTVIFSLTATGAGTANNPLAITLPVTGTGDVHAAGDFWFNDAGTAFFSGIIRKSASTSVNFYQGGSSTAAMGQTGGGFTAAIAATDSIEGIITYESAT